MAIQLVKLYDSSYVNAPQLTGTSGALIGLLDTLLLTGFNVSNVQSVTKSGTDVTVVTSTTHGFSTGQWVELSGSGQPTYNGDWRVTVINPTSFKFTVPADYPATITGTMTVRYPRLSAYWQKTLSATHKAIYRSTHPNGTQFFLRVDDTDARAAQVSLLEGWDSIDTGFVNASLHWWIKSNVASAATRPWTLIGDGKRFYLVVCWTDYGSYHQNRVGCLYRFGDITPTKPGDAYHTMISGYGSAGKDTALINSHVMGESSHLASTNTNGVTTGNQLLRSYTQIGTLVTFSQYSLMRGAMGHDGWPYPNYADNGLYIESVYVMEGSVIRGFMPGIYCPLQAIQTALSHLNLAVKNPPQMPDREFAWIRCSGPSSGAVYGGFFADMTGPWD